MAVLAAEIGAAAATAAGELWVGDFTGSGSSEVLAVSQGVGNWQLGTLDMTDPQAPTLTFTGIGNTRGFGVIGNTVWKGRFSAQDRDQLLFYNAGDSTWWLGTVTSTGPTIDWSLLAIKTVQWMPNAGSWVCDLDGTGADTVVAYCAADSSWWAATATGGALNWTQIGETAGLTALQAGGTPAGSFTTSDQQLLGYNGAWHLITLSSAGEPVDVQDVPGPATRVTTFWNDVARLWSVAPFGPDGSDSIITCNLISGDWLNGSLTSPNGPEAPVQADFVTIGNAGGAIDLVSSSVWVASIHGMPTSIVVYSSSSSTWSLGTASTTNQRVDQLAFTPIGVAGESLFGPTQAQIDIVQNNLANLRNFNDYVYTHTDTKLDEALGALEQPSQDPGVGAVLALFEATISVGATFMPLAEAGAFMGTFVNGLLSSWTTNPPSSLGGNLLSWINRYEKTSISFDRQLATYAQNVPAYWSTSFTVNGQTSVLSDLAFTDIPDQDDDPSFYDMVNASILATQQAMWKQILPVSFVALELSDLYVSGDKDEPPISWAQKYYQRHPNAYRDVGVEQGHLPLRRVEDLQLLPGDVTRQHVLAPDEFRCVRHALHRQHSRNNDQCRRLVSPEHGLRRPWHQDRRRLTSLGTLSWVSARSVGDGCRRHRLADSGEHGRVPLLVEVERLAALDPLELDRPQFVPAFLVVADHARLTAQCAVHCESGHRADQLEVALVGRRGPGEVAGLLDQSPSRPRAARRTCSRTRRPG